MVVRRRHRHHLLGADRGADRAEAGRVPDRAGGDDRPLALHQPRHRGDRADAARVGERDVRALQIVRRELVVAGAGDQVVERGEEVREREPAGVADHRHHQRPPAVLALDVDCDAEVDLPGIEHVRLAVDLLERASHHRHLLGRRASDRVGDQVSEGDALAGLLELLAAGVERRDRQRAERGRGRHRARLVHVAREHRARALDQRRLRLGRGGRAVRLGGQHVGLRDPAGRAGPPYGREVDAQVGRHASGDRCDLDRVRDRRRRAVLRGRRGGRLGRLGRGGPRTVAGGHARDDLADVHGVTGLGEDLGDRARRRRGDLRVDLVGGHLDERLVLGDLVAGLLGPLEDRALGHRLAHRRHLDIDGLRLGLTLGRRLLGG
jgi:hypothetical protein